MCARECVYVCACAIQSKKNVLVVSYVKIRTRGAGVCEGSHRTKRRRCVRDV